MTQRYIFCLLLLCACVKKQDAEQGLLTKEEVASFVNQYDQAWNSKDTLKVNEILGPDYIYFNSVGGLSTRAETLQFLGDSSYVILDAKRSEVEVKVTGNTAVVSSHWKGELIWKGDSIHDNQRCGQVYLKRDGKILLISEHCVAIQAD
ncbi:MAG TPA: nuclear transport factor 2 family protein [Ohtaekwangia sp.]|uniref:nuclear transport factor 2 family protein n=1 Tax=Ohtaekwangia sp. TaxID=2066019 RepID=UPI002F923579